MSTRKGKVILLDATLNASRDATHTKMLEVVLCPLLFAFLLFCSSHVIASPFLLSYFLLYVNFIVSCCSFWLGRQG